MRNAVHGAMALLGGVLGLGGCATTDSHAGGDLPDDPAMKEWSPTQKDFKLASGMRVLVEEDHTDPVVVVTATFGVGGTSDPKGSEGLAHFVEHLVFRARPLGGDQVWDMLKRVGGSFNASTAADETNYYVIAHKDELETMMRIQALRLLDPLGGVTQEVFDTEREVVRNELRQRFETTVGNKVFDMVLDNLFPPGHPLHRPLAGTHETLSHASLAEAREFVARHYRPENCTMVIAGDVNRDQVAKLLGTWPAPLLFGPGGPGSPPVPPRKRIAETPAPPVPLPWQKQLVRIKGPVAQPQLILAWSMPGAHRGNDAFLSFATTMLNININQNLRHKYEDELESIGAVPEELADASVMMVQANLKPGSDPEKLRARILDALVGEHDPEFERALVSISKWYSGASLLMSIDDAVGRALVVSEYLHATGRTTFYSDRLDEIPKISPSEIAAFNAQWLTRDRAVSIFVEPENAEIPKVTTAAGGGGGGGGAKHEVARGATGRTDALGPEGIRRVARAPGIDKMTHYRLPNGVEMYAARHGSVPIARIRMQLRGGNAMVKPLGTVGLAYNYVRAHCRQYPSLDAVGGSAFNFPGETSSSVLVDVLEGNLANGMAALSDEVTCMEPDEDRFQGFEESLKERRKRQQRIDKQPEFIAGKKLWAALYPHHPYGDFSPDPDTLKDVKLDDLAAFMKNQYQPQNATMVVLGDIDPEQAKALAEKYLARWTGGGTPSLPLAPPDPMPAPETRKVFVIDRPGATQAQITVACRLAAEKPETVPAYDVADHILNDEAWKIREEWGATYGIHASIGRLPGGAVHAILDGAVENAQAGVSLKRVLDIVARVASGAGDEDAFLQARWDVALEFSRRFAGGTTLAGGLLTALGEGWPVDVWDRYPERLAQTRLEDIAETIKPCVGKEIVTVVGDASVLRPQISAAGLPLQE